MQTATESLVPSIEDRQPVEKPWTVLFLPSLTDVAFALPLFILFGILPGSKLLLSDADVGWHLRTGEWILDHRAVPVRDLFSFTRPGEPWFAWEWGWDVCFGAIHRYSGLGGVVLANVLILCLVSVLTFRLIRHACSNDVISLAITAIAMCGSTVHWLARPHLLSWLFFLAFAHLIARASEHGYRSLLWLPPLTLLWTNIHGSFFLGICMLVIAAVAPFLQWAVHGGSWRATWTRSVPFLTCVPVCAAVTLINPYGWRLHEHLITYLRDPKQMNLMQEFQSLNFHFAPAGFVEIMLLMGAASLFWCAKEGRWYGFLTVLMWAHLGLFAVRNIPIYLFLSAPWIGCMLADAVESSSRGARWIRKYCSLPVEFQPLERLERLYLFAAAGLIIVALNVAAGRGNFSAGFDPKIFPEKSLAMINRYRPTRIFANDQWSAYLIYQCFPKQKVFIDDRSDFYGAAMLDRVGHILNARWDWEADLLRFSTDMVIVAPDAPLATVLKGSPRWQLVLDNRKVVVFERVSIGRATNHPDEAPAQKSSAVVRDGGRKLGV